MQKLDARKDLLLTALTILVSVTIAQAQPVPVGAEFQVNTFTTEEQFHPSAAADGAGSFVIVWTSGPSLITGTYPRPGQDGSETGIFGQRYDSAGNLLGLEFRINTFTGGYQLAPDVASDLSGAFVVVWESSGQAAPLSNIYGRRYDSDGLPLGAEFQVNTSTTFSRSRPAVASDADGNFVVAWEGSIEEVFARRFDSTGAPVGGEFQVNTVTSGIHGSPDVAVNEAGQLVVSWVRLYAAPGTAVSHPVARVFDGSGPVTGELQASTYADNEAIDTAVAVDDSGDFVVLWNNIGSGGSGPGPAVLGRRFDSTGSPFAGDFVVDGHGGDVYSRVDASMDAMGTFQVVWELPDTSGPGIGVRAFDSAGAAMGGPVQVNTYVTGSQVWPAIAADPAGNFVVAWTTSTLFQSGQNSPDGSLSGVFAQRFEGGAVGPLPAGVRVTPRKLNVKSNGKWISAKIRLPDGFSLEDVDTSTLGITSLVGPGCPGPYSQPIDPSFGVRPKSENQGDAATKLLVKLNRKTLNNAICLGEVEITIGGSMLTGEAFSGSDVIKAFRPGKDKGNGNGNAGGNGNGHGNGGGNGNGNGHGNK